jgi:hypothetical protein
MMSGQSTTLTFVCDHERRDRVLSGLQEDDLSAIDDLKEPNVLFGSSRNNAMEWLLNRLIRECHLPNLKHLQKGFDPLTGATLDAGWWPAWLAPDEVELAVNALDTLLELTRKQPERIQAALPDGMYCPEHDELRALAAPAPTWPAAAAAAYKAARKGNEGDDLHSVFAFVKAHRAILNLARERVDGAMYLVYLY